jgi:hypothetical protein
MSNKPVFEFNNRVAGHFILETRGPDGSLRKRLEFDNLITDTGMASIFSSPGDGFGVSYLFSACVVGTGNTAPAVTDTQLASWLATRSNGQYAPVGVYVAGPPAYWKMVCSYQFGTGVAAGNLTEVGIYPFNKSNLALLSRALIVDGSGNPTTLVVEADEILNVTYEFRIYQDLTDKMGTFVSDGVTYDIVSRVSDIDTVPRMFAAIAGEGGRMLAYDGTLGTITTAPSGSSGVAGAGTGWSNYLLLGDTASAELNQVFDVNTANFANGVRAMYLATSFHKFQISFNDPLTSKGIPKVLGEQMSCTFKFSWSRYAP